MAMLRRHIHVTDPRGKLTVDEPRQLIIWRPYRSREYALPIKRVTQAMLEIIAKAECGNGAALAPCKDPKKRR